jgi:hypothetical protein
MSMHPILISNNDLNKIKDMNKIFFELKTKIRAERKTETKSDRMHHSDFFEEFAYQNFNSTF